MLPEIFRTRDHPLPLPLAEERELLASSQAGNKDATWRLITQYAGLLQATSYEVRARAMKMTPDQIEDLESALVLATLESIAEFDPVRFVRLSQVLPGKLKDVAFETTTALTVPRGTLSLWFKIRRAADGDTDRAVELAPNMGMSANTFRAIAHSLDYVANEWITVPYNADKPAADTITHDIIHKALALLYPAEREVIELFYGFRGDTKTDQEVANMRETSKTSAVQTRLGALKRLRVGIGADV